MNPGFANLLALVSAGICERVDKIVVTESDFMVLGMIATALPAVHAIPAVCAAQPGIVSYAELPLVAAAHCLR